jgi:hypothetical protein
MTLPPGHARTALAGALDAFAAFQAGCTDEEMPVLDHKATVALAGVVSVALEELGEAGGDVPALLLRLYRLAHGIPAPSS